MMKITQINFGDLPAQGASDLRQISVSGAPPVEQSFRFFLPASGSLNAHPCLKISQNL